MKILSRKEIEATLPSIDLLAAIEAGFVAYSKGEAVVPPVAELIFDKPPGDVHIKYGYLKNDSYYVLKVASGFYDNPSLGLTSNNGLMLLFKQQTGQLEAILLDEGILTDIRTAVAGAIAAKHLARKQIQSIGIVGTGVQSLLQLKYLKPISDCREVLLWGRDAQKCASYVAKAKSLGFNVAVAKNANDLLSTCNLIVTTTAACEPLLTGIVKPGTHITAVGSDTQDKQELSTSLLEKADLLVADSIDQCQLRGEIHHAINDKSISKGNILELGNIISGTSAGRLSENQITIADLTGVAVQDISISKAIYESAHQIK